MYVQAEKSKENKNRVVGYSVVQKKVNVKQSYGFADNRPETKRNMFLGGKNAKKIEGIENISVPIQRQTAVAYNPVYNRPGSDGVFAVRHARIPMTDTLRDNVSNLSGYGTDHTKAPGTCNHHVPYKMVRDKVESGMNSSADLTSALTSIQGAAATMGLVGMPAVSNKGTATAPAYPENEVNDYVDSLIGQAANDSNNLFYWPNSSGDGNGTKIDEPSGAGKIPIGNLRFRLHTYKATLKSAGLTI